MNTNLSEWLRFSILPEHLLKKKKVNMRTSPYKPDDDSLCFKKKKKAPVTELPVGLSSQPGILVHLK
jgi:hypothetical protein